MTVQLRGVPVRTAIDARRDISGWPTAKRVAIDAHVLSGMHQGSRTYLANILHWLGELDRLNHYQIFSFDPAETRRLLDFPNFSHHKIAVAAAVPRLLFYWPYAKRKHKFDVLMTQYILPPFVRGPHFLILHDILPETHPELFPPLMRWRSRLFFRLSAGRATDIFVVSNYTRSEVIKHYAVAPEKVHLTYNGFDRATFNRLALAGRDRESGDYILYVGRLEARKNVDIIIAALRKARLPGARLVIVGRKAFAPKGLLRLLREAADVEQLENVGEHQLDMLYRGARAFVYPSSAEGFGLPILEALARGVPVITSNRTSLPEVGGAFVRYFDPTATDAADRLAVLLSETWLRPGQSNVAAVGLHLAKFDWETSARTILQRIGRLP
jgi:glycosyltransferase involved in cell wall biosynthesis